MVESGAEIHRWRSCGVVCFSKEIAVILAGPIRFRAFWDTHEYVPVAPLRHPWLRGSRKSPKTDGPRICFFCSAGKTVMSEAGEAASTARDCVRHGCRTQASRDGFTACPGRYLLPLWPGRSLRSTTRKQKGRHNRRPSLRSGLKGQISSSRSNIADSDSSLLMRRMVSASIGASDSTRMRPVALAASDSGTVSVTTS
jgi:hypothetical protein